MVSQVVNLGLAGVETPEKEEELQEMLGSVEGTLLKMRRICATTHLGEELEKLGILEKTPERK